MDSTSFVPTEALQTHALNIIKDGVTDDELGNYDKALISYKNGVQILKLLIDST